MTVNLGTQDSLRQATQIDASEIEIMVKTKRAKYRVMLEYLSKDSKLLS